MKAIRNEKGIALFLVLWVLTLLSVIAGEFCFAMRTEVNITHNFKRQTTAYYIALAGVSRAIGELIRNEAIPPKATPPKIVGREEQPEDEEEGDRWRINTDIAPVSYGEGQYEVRIGNESGKININAANGALLKMMLDGFDLEGQQKSIIVDSIMDWRDKDNLHRLNGAEDDYYKSLPEPYECKDGDFDSVEELLMVRGVTPDIFYGGLKDMVTVHPNRGLRIKSTGDLIRKTAENFDPNKININAASRKILLSLPSMTDDLVEEIMSYRKKSDFKSLIEISSIVGTDVYNAISPYITLEVWPYYSIISIGKVEGSKVRQGVEVLVEINRKHKKRYRVVQWRDSLQYQGESDLK